MPEQTAPLRRRMIDDMALQHVANDSASLCAGELANAADRPRHARKQGVGRGECQRQAEDIVARIVGGLAVFIRSEVIARGPWSPTYCCLTAAYSTDVIGEVSFFGRSSVTRAPLTK
jgi:hypothetical protein